MVGGRKKKAASGREENPAATGKKLDDTIDLDSSGAKDDSSVVEIKDDSSVVEVSDGSLNLEKGSLEKSAKKLDPTAAPFVPVPVKAAFVPVKPGGQKLDDTLELSSGDDDSYSIQQTSSVEVKAEEETRYTTTVEDMTNADSFQTPQVALKTGDFRQTSTPRNILSSAVKTQDDAIEAATKRVAGEGGKSFDAPSKFQPVFDEVVDEMHQTNGSIQDHTLVTKPTSNGDGAPMVESNRAASVDSAISVSNASSATPATDMGSVAAPVEQNDAQVEEESTSDDEEDIDATDFVLPKTCTLLKTPSGAKVYLIGTAHFSRESHEDVERVIRAVQPDVVMVELCKSRVNILYLDEDTVMAESQRMSASRMVELMRQKGSLQGALYILLLSMSAHLTKELGMAPGGEFRVAHRESMQVRRGCTLHLGDRPIDITLKRALHSLSLWQKLRLGFNMLTTTDTITKEEVEKCKEKDMLEGMLQEMAGDFPGLSRAFVHERDIFLTHSLQMAVEAGKRERMRKNLDQTDGRPVVVGVVGIGHCPGIEENWLKVRPYHVAEVMALPEPSLLAKTTKVVIKLSFYSLLAYGAYRAFRKPVSGFIKTKF